jgi:hypothetical protein
MLLFQAVLLILLRLSAFSAALTVAATMLCNYAAYNDDFAALPGLFVLQIGCVLWQLLLDE